MATSVVPPPMSTTIAPMGSVTGKPAPIAAAIGSSIRYTRDAPALDAASRIARRSTVVDPEGTPIPISGRRGKRLGPPRALSMTDRKSAVWGKSGSVRVELGGGRILKKKKQK